VPARARRERFGDLLALARQGWVHEMAARLADQGFAGYRRSDALVLRSLRRGPLPVGRLAGALGVSRQAARKVVDSLERRGYATTERDGADARRLNVVLTSNGAAYADAVVAAVVSLNRDFESHVDPARMEAAREVLLAVLTRYAPEDPPRRPVRA
jgi:DNA-binding MarR family transcriptional regulator